MPGFQFVFVAEPDGDDDDEGGEEGAGASRNGPLFESSLSLQRWKCETLIDHFNWKAFVLQRNVARTRLTEILNKNKIKYHPILLF